MKTLRQNNGLAQPQHFTISDMNTQYMIQTGKTLFKGMEYEDLKRLQFNIESTGLSLTDSEILIICYTCGDKSDYIIGDENFIIEHFFEVIKRLNPDVIESYNGFSFDFQLLMNRAAVHDIRPNIGRNNSDMYMFQTHIRMGDNQSVEIMVPKIWGRHCVDLYYSVRAWDAIYRELETYKLDDVSERFGKKFEDMNIDKTKIAEFLKTDKQLIIKHCMDDCLAVDHLSKLLTQKDFYQTQMLPMNYEKVCIASSSTKMTGMFVREYYRQGHAIPIKQEKIDFEGAMVGAEQRGIFEHVYHLDVNSLYPSVMLNYNVCPKSDKFKVFPKLLKTLTDLRFSMKAQAKETGLERYKAEEQSTKILINSLYGLLGSNVFQWNDMEEASRVTKIGRETLQTMCDFLTKKGYITLERDTDGVYITKESWQSQEK